MIGDAFCECGFHLKYIPLTGKSEPCTHCGGKNWEVVPNFSCINCGTPLKWLHEPGADDLKLQVETRELHPAQSRERRQDLTKAKE